MRRVAINGAEIEALQYLDPFDVKLYLIGLRRHMDFTTGRVGEVRRISYQQLSEETESAPEARSRAVRVKPSVKKLRCALERLERHGLVVKVVRPFDPGLVFLLPLADRGPIRSDFEGQMRGRGKGSPQSANECGFAGDGGQALGFSEGHTSGSGNSMFSNHHPADPEPMAVDNLRPDDVDMARQEGGGEGGAVALPVVPVQPGQWWWFFRQQGWSERSLSGPRVLGMFRAWCERGVGVALVRDLMGQASRYRPRSVLYFGEMVAQALDPVAQEAPAGGAWFERWSGIMAMAEHLGMTRGLDEAEPYFKARVLAAAGVSDGAGCVAVR